MVWCFINQWRARNKTISRTAVSLQILNNTNAKEITCFYLKLTWYNSEGSSCEGGNGGKPGKPRVCEQLNIWLGAHCEKKNNRLRYTNSSFQYQTTKTGISSIKNLLYLCQMKLIFLLTFTRSMLRYNVLVTGPGLEMAYETVIRCVVLSSTLCY